VYISTEPDLHAEGKGSMPLRRPHLFWLVQCLLILSPLAWGQGGEWTVYTRENSGLPDNNVLSLLAAPDGGLWIGTRFEGVAFLDGGNWSYFKPPAPPGGKAGLQNVAEGPQAQAIYDLALDSTGVLWVGTKVHGLLRFDGSTWTRYDTVNSDLPDNYAWSVVIDGENRVWVGTRYGGVAVFDGGSWVIYNTHNSPLPSDDVGCLALDRQQGMWIGTRRGLAILRGNEWQVYTSANSGLPYDYLEAIAIDQQGAAWLGTFGGGLVRFDGQQWQVYRHATSGLPSDSIYSLSVGQDGTVWAGTFAAGLAAFDGRNWTVFNSHNSPVPHDLIYETTTDRDGALWVATTLGLACYHGGAGGAFKSRPAPLPSDFVLASVRPNPFMDATRLTLTLPFATQAELEVFDLRGSHVVSLLSGFLSPGTHELWWNGRDQAGEQVPAGVYFARLRTPYAVQKVQVVRLH